MPRWAEPRGILHCHAVVVGWDENKTSDTSTPDRKRINRVFRKISRYFNHLVFMLMGKLLSTDTNFTCETNSSLSGLVFTRHGHKKCCPSMYNVRDV